MTCESGLIYARRSKSVSNYIDSPPINDILMFISEFTPIVLEKPVASCASGTAHFQSTYMLS